MKKNEQKKCCEVCPCNDTQKCPKAKQKPDTETKIYNFLNTLEKISVKLAQINEIRKKSAKKKKKKIKKFGKVDKKTGTLILKKQKHKKPQKPMKRYKPPKKK